MPVSGLSTETTFVGRNASTAGAICCVEPRIRPSPANRVSSGDGRAAPIAGAGLTRLVELGEGRLHEFAQGLKRDLGPIAVRQNSVATPLRVAGSRGQ